MRRYMMTMMFALLTWTGMNAMDYETARERAYYLTDKMAYELNLNQEQYNDAYEINLDYFLSIRTEADLVDSRYLANRNADLRHILYDWQWAALTAVDYLFNPLRWLNGGWYFPVYNYYTHTHYYYSRPRIYWDYRGGHSRYYYSHGYYLDRRPAWRGGLRGEHRGLVGHPGGVHHGNTPGRHHSGTTFDMRSGRFEHRPGTGIHHRDGASRPETNFRNNHHGSQRPDVGNNHDTHRPSMDNNQNTYRPNAENNHGSLRPNTGSIGHNGTTHTNPTSRPSTYNSYRSGNTRGLSTSSSYGGRTSITPRTSGSSSGSSYRGGSMGSSRGSSIGSSRGPSMGSSRGSGMSPRGSFSGGGSRGGHGAGRR